jgi:transcriptional regulator with XRE-family HTH domain
MNKSYSSIRREMMSWSANRTSDQADISAKTGVSQSQVSKILSGRFKTISPNVKKVCEYANIQINVRNELALTGELKEAVMDLLDGSRESEMALVKTLKTIKKLIGKSYADR